MRKDLTATTKIILKLFRKSFVAFTFVKYIKADPKHSVITSCKTFKFFHYLSTHIQAYFYNKCLKPCSKTALVVTFKIVQVFIIMK